MSHIHEKIDFTAEVFVVYRNKVLLRLHDKYKRWMSVGGHIELDEDPNEAAIREVKEEVGLSVTLWDGNRKFVNPDEKHKDLIPPVALNRHRVSPTHEHVTLVYFAKATSDKIVPQNEEDRSNDCRWLSKDELAAFDVHPSIRFYAQLALEILVS